tara:strand:- start:17 stop:517 length:501 start_codon:yes stop_codon:yes gene_type:complete
MESSTLESVSDESSHIYVPKIHKTIVNLNYFLTRSFNEYVFHLVENNLKLNRHDKNKLGIHFILNQIIQAVNIDKEHKKLFYYKEGERLIEYQLVKRIFNTLPSVIKYGEVGFIEFIEEQDYEVWKSPADTRLSFQNFRNFLKRYDLKHLEREFLADVNIKLSLLP